MTNTVQGYRVEIAKEYGINVAIVYDKVMFWGDKGERKDGWVYKTYAEMEDETALSKKQISLAYEKLIEMGVIETSVKRVFGTPKKHFRLCQNALSESAKGNFLYIQKQTTEKESASFGEDSKPAPSRQLLKKLLVKVNPHEKPTADRERILRGRMKDYTEEEILAAATEFAKSEWHKENKQMSIDNLIAPSKFGRWYQAAGEVRGLTWTPPTAEEMKKREESAENRDWGF